MKKKAVIVIPIYKKDLNIFEKISLTQVKRILGKYPIIFAAPESLEFDYGGESHKFTIERFADEYFKSTGTYSELLLSAIFYERFADYEYMLIYQLDAFVFSDRLEEFCDLEYDYIGAPILGREPGIWNPYHVGNGGLSLRKISSTIELLSNRDEIMKDNPLTELFWQAEDAFFGYCGHRKDVSYKVPSVFVAATFAVQNDGGHGIRSIPRRGLPFGIHMWPMQNYQIWKPIVESFGYMLPNIDRVEYQDAMEDARKARMEQFIRHYLRGHLDEMTDIIKIIGIDSSRPCVIWGAGVFGKRCQKLLKLLSINVAYFCDKNAENLIQFNDVIIKMPTKENLKEKTIIIAVKNKGMIDEIEKQLGEFQLQKGENYFIYSEMVSQMEGYVKEHVGNISGITCPLQIENFT